MRNRILYRLDKKLEIGEQHIAGFPYFPTSHVHHIVEDVTLIVRQELIDTKIAFTDPKNFHGQKR